MTSNKVKTTKEYTTSNKLTVTPDEYSRIWGGQLTEADFCTSAPNPLHIAKLSLGINEYLKYKRKHMEE